MSKASRQVSGSYRVEESEGMPRVVGQKWYMGVHKRCCLDQEGCTMCTGDAMQVSGVGQEGGHGGVQEVLPRLVRVWAQCQSRVCGVMEYVRSAYRSQRVHRSRKVYKTLCDVKMDHETVYDSTKCLC